MCSQVATDLQVPYFNAPMFLQNKAQIGRIEEIFGGITNTVCHPFHSAFPCRIMLQQGLLLLMQSHAYNPLQ